MVSATLFPAWADSRVVDAYGNVACKCCKRIQSPDFKRCIFCCSHDELDFTEQWNGTDSCGGWELTVECAVCGKNFDFLNTTLIREYIAIRRKNR